MTVWRWSLEALAETIVRTLLNKFDYVLAIEGNRGLGKSTLGYKLMKMVSRKMRERGIDGFYFRPKACLLYRRMEAIKFFTKWNAMGMADEMINVTFNRDFYDENQKDLIKIMNMNRDHCNFFVACVPRFVNLDSQIKGLCKMRITVIRRGLAVIQTPNSSIYSADIWDTRVNEKIEREWIQKKTKNPKYSRLTTFRGLLKYSKLSEKDERIYQKVKDLKRNLIESEKKFLQEEEEKQPIDVIVERLLNKQIRNAQIIEGFAIANGEDPVNFLKKVSMVLKKKGLDSRLSNYYWDKGKDKNSDDKPDKEKSIL